MREGGGNDGKGGGGEVEKRERGWRRKGKGKGILLMIKELFYLIIMKSIYKDFIYNQKSYIDPLFRIFPSLFPSPIFKMADFNQNCHFVVVFRI